MSVSGFKGGGAVFRRFVPDDSGGGILQRSETPDPNNNNSSSFRTPKKKDRNAKLRSNIATGTQSLTRAVRIASASMDSPAIPHPPAIVPNHRNSKKYKFKSSKSSKKSNTPRNSPVSHYHLPQPPHAQVAQKIFRYDDFEYTLIGEGFFAQVYRARHKTQGEQVLALKRTKSNIIPQADQSRNILRERLILEKLKSPYILRFEGVCLIDNHIHVFTEYVNGGSLEKLIQNHAFPLSWKIKTKLASDISNGLTYLHDKKIFHRDVTSRNCLVRMSLKEKNSNIIPNELHSAVLNCYDFPKYFEPERAVLADFGLAEKIEDDKKEKSSGYTAVVGTPYWMAPEVLNAGEGKTYDERSDIFSLGIVVCELLSRLQADPEPTEGPQGIPRTHDFGLDQAAFKRLCQHCPRSLRKQAFRMCKVRPAKRPTAEQCVQKFAKILARIEAKEKSYMNQLLNKFRSDYKRDVLENEGVDSIDAVNDIKNMNIIHDNLNENFGGNPEILSENDDNDSVLGSNIDHHSNRGGLVTKIDPIEEEYLPELDLSSESSGDSQSSNKIRLLSRKTKLIDQPSNKILQYAANLPISRRTSSDVDNNNNNHCQNKIKIPENLVEEDEENVESSDDDEVNSHSKSLPLDPEIKEKTTVEEPEITSIPATILHSSESESDYEVRQKLASQKNMVNNSEFIPKRQVVKSHGVLNRYRFRSINKDNSDHSLKIEFSEGSSVDCNNNSAPNLPISSENEASHTSACFDSSEEEKK